jgi:processive 1,2-diacylglycerol beta-glucosyltransferase
MTRVLVLSASYGSGHNMAAQSVARAFEAANAQPIVVDHFRELVSPTFERVSRALYHRVLRWVPRAWGVAYAVGDAMTTDSPLAFGVPRLGARRLARLLATLAPDLVVTVHATPAVAMSALADRGVRVPPHVTVVTDFVAHSQWIARGVDRYCVAADEVKHEFIARGIAPDRIVVTGVPVRPEFEQDVDPAAARAEFGFAPDRPVVLAMAGAQGSFGRLPVVARALLATRRPAQAVIVAGRDADLQAKLERLTRSGSVRTLGYVATIRRLMAAADVLVTKAGGMTIAEAMAAELPLITYASLPGQERRNERFASRAGIALVARSRRELARALERALGDPGLLERLRAHMRDLRRPDASHRVAAAALGLGRIPR